jgi:DNA-directed RNA polymerase sigma subunit (sigma70/sigma32)
MDTLKENIKSFKEVYMKADNIIEEQTALKIIKKVIMEKLVEYGLTYEIVGQIFSVSRQRVEQILHDKK